MPPGIFNGCEWAPVSSVPSGESWKQHGRGCAHRSSAGRLCCSWQTHCSHPGESGKCPSLASGSADPNSTSEVSQHHTYVCYNCKQWYLNFQNIRKFLKSLRPKWTGTTIGHQKLMKFGCKVGIYFFWQCSNILLPRFPHLYFTF